MKQTGRTVIIGGGLAGVTTAYDLASHGVETVLLESNSNLGAATSFANGAMLTPSMPEPWNGPGIAGHLIASLFDPDSAMKLHPHAIPSLFSWGLCMLRNSTAKRHDAALNANFRLANLSLNRMSDLIGDLGIALKGGSTGTIKIFENECDMQAPLKTAALLKPYGLKAVLLNRRETINIEPQLKQIEQRIFASMHYPDDMVGDANDFVHQLGAATRQRGGDIRLNTTANKIYRTANGFTIETRSERISASNVILAAGNATAKIARSLGVRLPIQPVKGYSLTFEASHLLNLPRIAVVDHSLHVGVVPLKDRIRVVGTAEFTGHDLSISTARVRKLATFVSQLYPEISRELDIDNATAWAGLRPVSADGKPYIGETKIPGLWINSGHGHLGWTLAAGSAQLITEMLVKKKLSIDAAPYAVTRRAL